jgi:DNA-directed RNA polymerase subunit RPC12/RpoP
MAHGDPNAFWWWCNKCNRPIEDKYALEEDLCPYCKSKLVPKNVDIR